MSDDELSTLRDIRYLVLQLPSGVDEDADEEDMDPEDQVAHIGGLILRRVDKLLESKP